MWWSHLVAIVICPANQKRDLILSIRRRIILFRNRPQTPPNFRKPVFSLNSAHPIYSIQIRKHLILFSDEYTIFLRMQWIIFRYFCPWFHFHSENTRISCEINTSLNSFLDRIDVCVREVCAHSLRIGASVNLLSVHGWSCRKFFGRLSLTNIRYSDWIAFFQKIYQMREAKWKKYTTEYKIPTRLQYNVRVWEIERLVAVLLMLDVPLNMVWRKVYFQSRSGILFANQLNWFVQLCYNNDITITWSTSQTSDFLIYQNIFFQLWWIEQHWMDCTVKVQWCVCVLHERKAAWNWIANNLCLKNLICYHLLLLFRWNYCNCRSEFVAVRNK